MKRWIIIILPLIILCSCHKKEGLTYLTTDVIKKYFDTIKIVCDADNGMLWGENLFGPILFIDNRTRNIYANVQDKNGLLKAKDGIYTGVFPKERLIVTNSIEFGGTKYAMVPLPNEEDTYRITSRAIHSLFHSFQERHNLSTDRYSVSHMNEDNSRLLLKLEWKALSNALKNEGQLRDQAIRDALIFRGARREIYPDGIRDENEFECMEGLATFTYISLCTKTKKEFESKLIEYLDRIYKNPSYPFSYGFIHGALYASLLKDKGFDFKTIDSPNFDLAEATGKLYNIRLPEYCRDVAGSLALGYDLPAVKAEENEIRKMIGDYTNKIVNDYTGKPIVKINLESPNFSFEPDDIFSLDTIGTFYRKLRVSDNWGKLTVDDGGALIASDLKTLWVNASYIDVEHNRITGDGWHLNLNEGWHLVETGESFSVIKVKY
jgi:hypothetical protein